MNKSDHFYSPIPQIVRELLYL